MTFDRVLVRPRSSDDAQFGRIVLVPEGMIALNAAVEETVRAIFGGALVAELTDDEVNAAVAGDRSRTVSNLKIQKTLAAPINRADLGVTRLGAVASDSGREGSA